MTLNWMPDLQATPLKSEVTGPYALTQFVWCWELNPQIPACYASTLLTELHRLDLKERGEAKIKIQAKKFL